MIAAPRVALASGLAGAAGAAVLMGGRLDGSVVTALTLVVAARAAPAAAAGTPAAVRSLSAQMSVVPAWVGVLAVAVVHAGSADLADIRGANAVAGLPVARGSILAVVATWLALGAGALALALPSAGARTGRGIAVTPSPYARLEVLAVVLQAALLVTLFAGPQVRAPADTVPWLAGALLAAAILWRARSLPERTWLVALATALAGTAVVLVLIGERV